VFGDRIRGAAMRCEGFKQDRDDGSNVPEDSLSRRGWIWCGGQLERKDVGGSARFGNGMEWNGVGGEGCCRAVCAVLGSRNSWGPPSWAALVRHWVGATWWWAQHRPRKLFLVSQASSHASLPRPHRKKVDSTASASLPQPDRGRLAGILSTSRRRFPHPRFSVVRTWCTPSPVVQQRNELIELTELA
jgi:hypothetical protein